MNEQNLTMAGKGITSTEQAQRLGRIGGKKRTPMKKYAARLRELKRKGLTDETVKKLTDIMEDPECSVLDIRFFLDSIKGDEKITASERIKLANAYIKLHQSLFGTIVKMDARIDQRTVTYNINNPNDKYPRVEEEY